LCRPEPALPSAKIASVDLITVDEAERETPIDEHGRTVARAVGVGGMGSSTFADHQKEVLMRRSNFLWISLSCCLASAVALGAPGTVDAAPARSGVVRATLQPNKIVTFRNSKSGYCIGVEHGRTDNGALLKQGPCRPRAADQKWQVSRGGKDGTVSFKNVKSGRCMGVDGAKVTRGANIGQYDCHPSDDVSNQHWSVLGPADSNANFIVNQKSTKHAPPNTLACIGVERGQTGRAQLKQASCNPNNPHGDQIWAMDFRG
jgi:hypothetical protein